MHGIRGWRDGMTTWRWIALAVLLGSLGLGLQPQSRGWRGDHAHVTLGASVPAHTHPWDAVSATGRQADGAQTVAVGFTDPDGVDGGTVDVPPAPSALAALHGVTFAVAAPSAVVVSYRPHIPTPPPRG